MTSTIEAPAGAGRIPAEHILIVLLGAIGDVTRALPLLERVRRGYASAHITWAVEPLSAPLLAQHAGLDQVLLFDRPRGALEFIRFLRRVRAQHADLVLDLQRHLKSGIISRASGARLRLGFHRRNAREGNWLFNTHHLPPMPHFSSKLQQFLAFADWLGVPAAPVTFGLWLNDAEERRVEELLAGVPLPFVAAYVGSSCESRLWFGARTAAVADMLAARGVGVVLLGGPDDVEFGAAVAGAAGGPVRDLTGRTGLRDLIGIFRHAHAAFGPDSGPMHIAAAVGTPVVSLWGATSPARSGPWGSEAHAIIGSAPCGPCYLSRCPIGRLCMEHISVDAVCAKLIAVLDA
jgi:ADP-heptose:LPS heptosyltransferase